MEANTRYGYLDSVAGLLILHMIAFHIFRGDVYGTRAEECMRPLSFFMFWFFYKSGMFFKPRTCYEVLRKGWEKLLVPYLVFSIVGFLVWCLIQTVISGFDILSFSEQAILEFAYAGTLPGNVPLWFLPSLLIVQILFNTIYKSGGVWKYLTFICIGITYVIHVTGTALPFYLVNIPLGLASYSFGYIVKEYQYDLRLFVLSLTLYIVIIVFCPSSLSFRENHLIGDSGFYLLAIIFSFSGCIVINNVFKRFLPHSCPILHWIGRRTMDLYVPHMIILTLCLFVPKPLVPWLKETQCAVCFILLPVFSIMIELLGMGWIFGKAEKEKKIN